MQEGYVPPARSTKLKVNGEIGDFLCTQIKLMEATHKYTATSKLDVCQGKQKQLRGECPPLFSLT